MSNPYLIAPEAYSAALEGNRLTGVEPFDYSPGLVSLFRMHVHKEGLQRPQQRLGSIAQHFDCVARDFDHLRPRESGLPRNQLSNLQLAARAC